MGTGVTRQDASQRLGWFAIYLDDDRVLVRALNADGLPTTVSNILNVKEFLSEYTLDHDQYSTTILPLLRSAREALEASGGDYSGLAGGEATVFKALVLDQEHLPHLNKEQRLQAARDMLGNLPDFDDVVVEYKRMINTESIASRKSGNYDEAINLYGAMLRENPEDDHIFFNVARVYFEKGDTASCRNYLRLALEHDPQFTEAEKFLAYLNAKAPQENSEGRTHLRYRFLQPQPCLLGIEDREVEALVVDLSEAGARIKLATGAKAQLGPGLKFSVAGQSELTAPILPGMAAQVVWAVNELCGVAFPVSLDVTTDEFKHIIAYARLV